MNIPMAVSMLGISAVALALGNAWPRLGAVLWFVMPVGTRALIPGPYLFALLGPVDNKSFGGFLREPFARCFMLVSGIYVISTLWAPDPVQSMRNGVFTAIAGLMLVSILSRTAGSVTLVGGVLFALAPVVLVQALSTVLFVLEPSLKPDYYGSQFGQFILGDVATEAVRGEAQVNALSEDKSAGVFFVNGNRASMVMGVTALVYFSYGLLARRAWGYLVAVIAIAGVVATASKTGWLLVVVVPLLALVYARLADQLAGAGRLAVIPLTVLGSLAGILLLQRFGTAFLDRADSALVPRRTLWKTAWSAVQDNPLLGWGPEGCEREWATVAQLHNLDPAYPPHNFLLYGGADAGLPMILCMVLASWFMFSFAVRDMHQVDGRSRVAMALVGGAVWWAFWHGMGDNTTFYGVDNSVAIFGLGLALCHVARTRGASPRRGARPRRLEGAPLATSGA